jgi:hypothetical protein
MARKISDALEVPTESLESEGAFDAFAHIDSRLYIDPHLLQDTKTPELENSYQRFLNHFEAVIKLLDASTGRGDRFYREAFRRLVFRELPFTALGYSKDGIGGSGIGTGIARSLLTTAAEIVEAGVKDPDIFELVGLFEENVGADRVSDMIISIILPDVLKFSRRVATNLGVPTHKFKARSEEFELPYIREPTSTRRLRRPIILLPKEILRPLPVAYDWDDIDYVCAHNREVRERVNHIIGNTWKHATRRVSKRELRRVLLSNPEALRDLLSQYRKKPAEQYDFARDPAGELIWDEIAKEYAEQFPLTLDVERRVTADTISEVVTTICEHFRRLVEDNGMFVAFYNDSGNRRHERFAQLLFFAVADAYCAANNLDLNREPNAGRGPVDFKVSRGYEARVNVEVKYSSNNKLLAGFTKQLEIYNRAERTQHSIYLVIRTTESTATIDRLLKIRSEELDKGNRVPNIIVVDGRHRSSASKA